MSCLIIGDSIANIMAVAMPHCARQAVGGITSEGYVNHFVHQPAAELTVISLGANDHHENTQQALWVIRGRITTGRVVWLVPNVKRQATLVAINLVATAYGDRIVRMAPYVGKNLQPTVDQAHKIAVDVLQ